MCAGEGEKKSKGNVCLFVDEGIDASTRLGEKEKEEKGRLDPASFGLNLVWNR